MKNSIPLIICGVLLVLSLAAVGYLFFDRSQNLASITTLNSKLQETRSALSQTETDLTETQNALKTKQTELDQTTKDNDETIEALETDLKGLRDKYNELYRRDEQIFCNNQIDKAQISGVSTNQALIDPITSNIEKGYDTVSIKTTFDLVWNNSKTAIFEVINQNKEAYNIAVSWDWNTSKVLAIYDINSGCIMYVP